MSDTRKGILHLAVTAPIPLQLNYRPATQLQSGPADHEMRISDTHQLCEAAQEDN